jgi:hypothetical protein
VTLVLAAAPPITPTDSAMNATRVLVGKCRRDAACLLDDNYVASGELLGLGSGFTISLDANCSEGRHSSARPCGASLSAT